MQYRPLFIVANSKKHGGRCVAGIDLTPSSSQATHDNRHPRPFIRPISSDPARSLDPSQIAPRGMDDLPIFRTVLVPLLDPCPEEYQTENWLVDCNSPWWLLDEAHGRGSSIIGEVTTPPHPLWCLPNSNDENSGRYNSQRGQRDRIPEAEAGALRSSLAIVNLETLRIDKWAADMPDGEPTFRGNFKHNGRYFNLRITDLRIADLWNTLPQPFSRRPFENNPRVEPKHTGPVTLTISLGTPYEGYVYRLIANVQPRS